MLLVPVPVEPERPPVPVGWLEVEVLDVDVVDVEVVLGVEPELLDEVLGVLVWVVPVEPLEPVRVELPPLLGVVEPLPVGLAKCPPPLPLVPVVVCVEPLVVEPLGSGEDVIGMGVAELDDPDVLGVEVLDALGAEGAGWAFVPNADDPR